MARNKTSAPHVDTLPDELGLDREAVKRSLLKRLTYNVGKDNYTATSRDWLHALMHVVRDRLMERWIATQRTYYESDTKRVYYLSLEFLIGRTLLNSIINMDFYQECQDALKELDMDLEAVCEQEFDAALGNGGLGRLAACFLDSMATLNIAGYGYGIRYEYGMFRQAIENAQQVEHPDNWLRYGNVWEFARPELLYPVRFYGHVVSYRDERGHLCHQWCGGDEVMAMAYDTPVPGFHNDTVNNMRLWSAKATRDFELSYFNEGNYIKAVESKNQTENLSKVLYPDDTTDSGRTLRLQQQYFFVSASLQDILWRYCKQHGSFDCLPDKVAIQLNDTHPAIAIPELMRVLLDTHQLPWEEAWHITRHVFAYTNHTLLPEALETWPVAMLEKLLPRHMQIIYEINHRFLEDVRHWRPGDTQLLRDMSIIDEGGSRRVRMAHLAIVGSHRVNGVAALHTQLMCDHIFANFHQMMPDRFVNITNGITPRRWLKLANPDLCTLINRQISDNDRYDWIKDLSQLRQLASLADDAGLQQDFNAVKLANKRRLAKRINEQLGLRVNPESLFDVQIKRIHEYKRQLLNVLHIITLYNRLRSGADTDLPPRTIIFSGKAAPGYRMAKLIIRLINDVADIINHDPAVDERLKVAFVPNYDVSTAISIIPAADLSQQISTAGMEASGTGNMKLTLNGALTIGTLDGANIEIRDAVGHDNFFLFGLTADEVLDLRSAYDPKAIHRDNVELRQVLDMIAAGYFSAGERDRYRPIVDTLLEHGDHYMLLADYASYVSSQEQVNQLYLQPSQWTRKTIINVANMGHFSTDRTIMEYAEKIWTMNPFCSI